MFNEPFRGIMLGLFYLAALMTEEAIDFKKVDREFNRFIYRSIGPGHSITSILQWMSGEGVVETLDSKRFVRAFGEKLAAQYGVELLASLPLSMAIRMQADDGKPTTVADPESQVAMIYPQAQLELARGHRALTDAAASRAVLWDVDDVLLETRFRLP